MLVFSRSLPSLLLINFYCLCRYSNKYEGTDKIFMDFIITSLWLCVTIDDSRSLYCTIPHWFNKKIVNFSLIVNLVKPSTY